MVFVELIVVYAAHELALAQEGASKGITVNAIAPGYIDTDMVAAVPAPVLEKIVAKIPVGRLGKAEEIALQVKELGCEFVAFDDFSIMPNRNASALGCQTSSKNWFRRSLRWRAPLTLSLKST